MCHDKCANKTEAHKESFYMKNHFAENMGHMKNHFTENMRHIKNHFTENRVSTL